MADTPFCHTCGKASACSALMAYQSTGELPMTDTHCSCEPAPDALTLILLEMRAIHAILKRAEDNGLPVVTISA